MHDLVDRHETSSDDEADRRSGKESAANLKAV
jgi:hypothetical protein